MRKHFRWCLVLAAANILLPSLIAKDEMTPRQRRDLGLLASGRARSMLADEIMSKVRLRGSVAWEGENELKLRHWLREMAELRTGRIYSNGLVETDASISAAEVIKWLNSERLSGAKPRDDTLWATGTAVVEDLTNDQRPLGWKRYVPETVEDTRRRAEDHAVVAFLLDQRSLLSQADIEIPDQLSRNDTLVRQWKLALRTAGHLSAVFDSDLMVVGKVQLNGNDLVELLVEMDLISEEDRAGISAAIGAKEFRAHGFQMPADGDRLSELTRPVVLDPPDWVERRMRVRGVQGGRADVPEKTERAWVKAIDELRSEVLRLEIRKDISLDRYLEREPDLKKDVLIFLSGARISRTLVDQAAGTVRVEVTLPLQRLWDILRATMREVPSRGSALQPGTEN